MHECISAKEKVYSNFPFTSGLLLCSESANLDLRNSSSRSPQLWKSNSTTSDPFLEVEMAELAAFTENEREFLQLTNQVRSFFRYNAHFAGRLIICHGCSFRHASMHSYSMKATPMLHSLNSEGSKRTFHQQSNFFPTWRWRIEVSRSRLEENSATRSVCTRTVLAVLLRIWAVQSRSSVETH